MIEGQMQLSWFLARLNAFNKHETELVSVSLDLHESRSKLYVAVKVIMKVSSHVLYGGFTPYLLQSMQNT